jgi:hypothetical protein
MDSSRRGFFGSLAAIGAAIAGHSFVRRAAPAIARRPAISANRRSWVRGTKTISVPAVRRAPIAFERAMIYLIGDKKTEVWVRADIAAFGVFRGEPFLSDRHLFDGEVFRLKSVFDFDLNS